MAVEARYGGKDKWYSATVMKVKRSLIRMRKKKKKDRKGSSKSRKKGAASDSEVNSDDDDEEAEEPDELEIGMAVEARYGGKDKWYPATVMKVKKSRYGGPDRWTYDLKYDDG